MKRVYFILVVTFCLLINGCAGLSSNQGYTLYDDKVEVLAKQSVVANQAVQNGYASYEEVKDVLFYVNKLINLSSNFNQELYIKTYNETFTEIETGIQKYGHESMKKNFRNYLPKFQSNADLFARLSKEMEQRIAQDKKDAWNRQVTLMNQAVAFLNSAAVATQHSALMLSASSESVPEPNISFSESSETRNYLINTNKGLVQKKCRTLNNGTSYCF